MSVIRGHNFTLKISVLRVGSVGPCMFISSPWWCYKIVVALSEMWREWHTWYIYEGPEFLFFLYLLHIRKWNEPTFSEMWKGGGAREWHTWYIYEGPEFLFFLSFTHQKMKWANILRNVKGDKGVHTWYIYEVPQLFFYIFYTSESEMSQSQGPFGSLHWS